MVTKDMKIMSVVNKFPGTFDVFMQYGLHCIGCNAARYENIEEGAKVHSIPIQEFLIALNNAAKNSNTKKNYLDINNLL